MKGFLAHTDRQAGLLFILLGAGFALGAGAYDMGSAAQMGPGFFPRLLGVFLAVLGVAIFVIAKDEGRPASAGALPWRPLLAVCAGVAAFGLSLEWFGLFIASGLLVGVSSFGQAGRRWGEVGLSALVLALLACAVFAWGLKLPLPVWPKFG